MIDLKLREATDGDLIFAYEAKKNAFRHYVDEAYGWDEEKQQQLHKERFASQNFWIVNAFGVDVGSLSMNRQPDHFKVDQLFILTKYQGRGIGTAVMVRIIEDASASRIPVRLQVLKVNHRAQAFYRELGFKDVGISEHHVLMELPLPDPPHSCG